MKQRMIGFLCAGLIALGALCPAEGANAARKVTIDEAVSLAMENNIQLESSAIDVRVKKRGMDTAWSVFIPSVQATGTLARTNRSEVSVTTYPVVPVAPGMSMAVPKSVTVDLDEDQRWSAMGGLSMSLNLNLAMFEGLKATRQAYESGKLGLEQARKETEVNVRKAFYGILLQEGSLKYARDKLANSEERLKQTKANYQNGRVPELSLLQAQLSVETQRPAIKEAELNLAKQKAFFAFMLGLPIGTEIALDGSIDPEIDSYDADELVEKYLGNRLDIALIRANKAMMETQAMASKLQLYTPSVAVNQSFSPMLSPISEKWAEKDNWSDNSGAFSLTLAFNLTNLLPVSAPSRALKEAEDNAEKLDLAMQQAIYNAELEIRNLVDKLEKSRTSITAMELSVSIASKAYRLTEEAYRAGTTEYLDLKDAENSLLQAQIGVLSEKFTYLSTLLDLEKALNAKLD